MFELKVTELTGWLCENAGLKEFPSTFDDRGQDSGIVIKTTGLIETIPGNGWTTLKKNYKIYVQYKNNELEVIIGLLTQYIRGCQGAKILGILDDNKTVFNELMTAEYSNKNYNFAYIILEMSQIIKAIPCKPC